MVELREHERRTLLTLKDLSGKASVEVIAKTGKMAHVAVMRAALALHEKGLVKIYETKRTKIRLNEEGLLYANEGLPERKLVEALNRMGGETSINKAMKEAGLSRNLFAIALGWVSRKGWVTVDRKERVLRMAVKPPISPDEKLLKLLREKETLIVEDLDEELKMAFKLLKGRKILLINEETQRKLELTKEGWKLARKGIRKVTEVTQLTPALIASGRWREVKLLKYNIKAPVARIWPGKKHPYLRFLDHLRDRLVALGFKEMTGPIVELSFFNCDALYMPQNHPAREVHDMYFIEKPKYGRLDRYLDILRNVKETHENGWKTGSKGWRYNFSTLEASRLMLRSQTTALSARTLLSRDLEIPGKYFAIARCYRPDIVDRTHLTEFNQVEGIVLGEDLSFRDLLGILKRFAVEIAEADKIKFKPGYFPFTEPSVELHAYKEGYGWLEFGGAGIFRPEVTLPLGVRVPVLAWGLGVDRIFMMKTGIDDIRFLFTQDLEWLRGREVL
ncbi:TPA: phenylalanine--tRNA ligase subunit alpha [Candidatus Bathyarchaeota archaeon]|nr:phenylalanine--tRNA ligase subunit alpha [Candidatus Bathyarchaeota archaeon]